MNEYTNDLNEYGSVKISDEVVCVVASIAVTEVKGVSPVTSIAGGIAEKLGKKAPLSKGVKADIDGNTVVVDIHIQIDYAVKIPAVSAEIQDKVKVAVENMTGLIVEKVNVYVDSVVVEKAPKVAREIDTTVPEGNAEADELAEDSE